MMPRHTKLEEAILEVLGESRYGRNNKIRFKLRAMGFLVSPHLLGSILVRLRNEGRVASDLTGGKATWKLAKGGST